MPLALQIAERLVSLALEENNEHCLSNLVPVSKAREKRPGEEFHARVYVLAQITGHEWGLFALSSLRTSFFSTVLLNSGSLDQAGRFLKVL